VIDESAFRYGTVHKVLHDLYLAASSRSDDKRDDFKYKAKVHAAEAADLLGVLDQQYGVAYPVPGAKPGSGGAAVLTFRPPAVGDVTTG
jgi:hypothetical protein